MKKYLKNTLLLIVFSGIMAMGWTSVPVNLHFRSAAVFPQLPDSVEIDTTGVLPYPFRDKPAFETPGTRDSSGLYLQKPSNIKTQVEYDPVTGTYILQEKIGDMDYRLPKTMSLQEYVRYDFQNSIRNYWRQRASQADLESQGTFIPRLTVGGEAFNRIFGGNTIDVRPQGYVEVSFGYQMNSTENPSIPERLRKTPSFDFDQKIQMNVNGSIGEKMKMRVNYNTEATFDYENKMNLDYSGDEDDIIKKIEAGNVSLPLNGSLISGGTNLFGVKTEMQFGKLNLTTIFSQNKGETKVVEMEGGAQKTQFEVKASAYDANRHFFLSQYFRDHYDEALAQLPVIRSSVTINKIEVWVTNKSGNYNEARNILALMDLGEHASNLYNSVPGFGDPGGQPYPENVYPFNGANSMYEELTTNYGDIREVSQITKTMAAFSTYGFAGGQDFEKIEQARKLNASEYTVNLNLGYISLNSALNADEVLAVAFNYTANGKTYQVGEFSSDGIEAPQTLVLKLLKGTNLSPKLPTWKLMMKNIYNLNAYQLSSEEFILDVLYLNDSTGTYINYLPESNLQGHILLNVLNLDNLNSQLDPGRNGVFDFIEGVTVHSASGRIIFPSVEPFGSLLRDSIQGTDFAEKYVYQSLYDSTRTYAEQDASHNKYVLKGSYKGSSSSEISLGTFNLAQGSVKVTSGGITLVENIDYTVDYTLGRVKIINPAYLESGANLQISTESEDLFTVQRKTLIGTHANYAFSDNFNLGATILYMNERPLTQKVNYGDDPISNAMFGLDANYTTQSNLLTKLVDKLPFIETKEVSTVSVEAEVAQLVVGESGVTNSTVYIDDFESTQTSIDLRARQSWVLASTPQKQARFPEGDLDDELAYSFNRAKLAWYVIDPLFLRNTAQTPAHIRQDKEQLSDHLVREVYQREIFPDKDTEIGVPTNISVFDLAYYPEERGPYNFDTNPSPYSAGINPDGTLRQPETRWGGIMRKIETTDFESANVEYIEFWMMDPFVNDTLGLHEGGDLYFNLGDISEDMLKDSRKSFENGLPETDEIANVDTTVWGQVSNKTQITNSFVTDPEIIIRQDVGFDGLSDAHEQTFYSGYLQAVQNILDQDVLEEFLLDPSGDNYHYYRGSDFDAEEVGIRDRYKKYNGPEGNSVPASKSPESYTTSAYTLPDVEDINSDNTLNEYERYYQYRVSIRREDMILGNNYISDIRTARVELANGKVGEVKWYQFKVPVKQPEQVIGGISDFSSIRFMRMFLSQFSDPVFLRFATLELVRADWRRYTDKLELLDDGTGMNTQFDVSVVNIEENSDRKPVNYILPPGIDRVIDPSNAQLLQLNEQSLVLRATDLEQGDSRAAYKNIYLDFRQYKRLKLELHAEELDGYPVNDDELYFFMRIGSDYDNSYYEYEVPLKLTAPGLYNGNIEGDRYAVWPEANRINIPLTLFTDVKLSRNEAMHEPGSTLRTSDVFEMIHEGWNDNKNYVKVKGNPNLGNVEVMMMGIRHKKTSEFNPGPKSVEVWANELRLSELDDNGGWAANLRVSTKLADLGSVVFAGRHRSVGFGSIDQSASERAMDALTEFDISSSLELGKFFPKEAQVRIPLYVGVSRSVSNPKYNPLDPDVTMKDALRRSGSSAEKDSIKKVAQDFSTRKSIVLNNVKVDKVSKSGKPRLYDPANFSVSYSFNEEKERDINTKYSTEKSHRGALTYNFSTRPEVIEPFKNSKLLKGNAFKLVKDFNFYLLPTQISYRNELFRYYKEVQTRNIANPNLIIPLTVEKDFIWRRNFDIRYNLTRSLKVDFSSEGTARIDEPEGRINRGDDDYQIKKDSILTNLLNMGRPVLYHHVLNASYQVPINKFPLFNWITLTGRYQAMYDWTAGSLTDEAVELGNVVENSRVMQGNGQFSMLNLYNKVPFLKEVNQRFVSQSRSARSSSSRAQAVEKAAAGANGTRVKEVEYSSTVDLKANVPSVIDHKLKTREVQVQVFNERGMMVRGSVEIVNENQVRFTPVANLEGAKLTVKGKRQLPETLPYKMALYTARTLMSVKTLAVTYSSSDGTVLPGFMPEPSLFGSGKYSPDPAMFGNIASTRAPGLPFLLGWQDENFARDAALKGWITRDTTLNAPYTMSHNETFTFRADIEPLPFLRIDLTANRGKSENISEYYIFDSQTGNFNALNRTERGNFTMSVNTWKTAFSKMGEAEIEVSDAYQTMLDNRIVIARRLAARRVPNPAEGYDPQMVNPQTGYPLGYGPTSQQVMIPAFIAAYTGQSAEKVALEPFPSLKYMRPNWRITYDGVVSKIKGLSKVAKSINLNHSYRSSYNVGSYLTNLSYDDAFYGDGFSYVTNLLNGDFVNQYDINSVSITEQLNPLINIDVTWLNDMSTRVEIKRARNLTLNFANNQLTEVLSNEVSFGFGYRFQRMDLIIKTKNSQKAYSNDLNIRADLSFRKNKTLLRKLMENDNQLTAGQNAITIKTTADYMLSDRFQLRLYYDKVINEPFTSSAFPTATTNFGVSFRFTLAQ
ncbi:cell surface protein SprA [Gaoshiqia sediminis]|uniref:Cell surface protein SprA n=1 Tax=Gaoshiqia sediminis TaxID=2986998 RepID=A0AA41Y732_9BACT|nr:cell surface protein SprA [Gaoshiqia sediminis]MCW0482681.1 cell surface protein SprA [Gaoshiqia sediminis]